MTSRRSVALQQRQEIQAELGETLAAASVDPQGELITLSIRSDAKESVFASDTQEGWAVFPKARADEPYAGVVRLYGKDRVTQIDLEPSALAFPVVQRLGVDEVLIAATRCQRYPDGSHDLNAHVYGLDGRLCREFLVGDGIEHLLADADGRIWVGYFDEGIFGNCGWGNPGGPEPIGAAGLVCFDGCGDVLWEFAPPNERYIADCDALNVSGNEAWTCYYESYPLVRIDEAFEATAWDTTVSGARAVAVSDDRAVFFGGYDDRFRCLVGEISRGKVEISEQLELTTPEGRPISALSEGWVIGRGAVLHFVLDGRLLDLDLSTL